MKYNAHLYEDPETGIFWMETRTLGGRFSVETPNGVLDFAKFREVDAELVSLHNFGLCMASSDFITVKNKDGLYSVMTPYYDTQGYGALYASICKGFEYKSAYGFGSYHGDYVVAENVDNKWGAILITPTRGGIWHRYICNPYSYPEEILYFEYDYIQDVLDKVNFKIPLSSLLNKYGKPFADLTEVDDQNIQDIGFRVCQGEQGTVPHPIELKDDELTKNTNKKTTMARGAYDPQVTIVKQRNAEVFRETTRIIKAGYYTTPSGKRIDLDMQAMIDGERCYHKDLGRVDAPQVEGGTTIMVEKGDCLKVAERLVGEGYHPALLNFASAGHPGGGVETGARAQEETICRRSTLSRSIYSFDALYAARYGYELHEGNGYPISQSLDFSTIYSPDVTIFREAGQEYTLMENPFQVAVITNAALNMSDRFPLRLTADGHIPEKGKTITLNKIRTIFRIGLIKGHDSLVLGAFGCGAFKTPPREMAQLFHAVMEEEEFKDRFRLITFAILSDHNDRSGNLAAFAEEFGR